MVPISKQVKTYIERKPYILEAIDQEIINYSALSRMICEELGLKNSAAVKQALLRNGKNYRKHRFRMYTQVIDIVRDATVSVTNKIATLHHDRYVDLDAIAYSKTQSGYVFFIKEKVARKLLFKNIEYGFAIIHIKSSKEIEYTPGWFALLFQALAVEGINVPHVMGVREDTFILVKEYDAALAFAALARKLRIDS